MVIILVSKALNNNIVLAINSLGEEVVLFGTGIGFRKKEDDLIDEEKVTKVFYTNSSIVMKEQLLDVPPNVLDVAAKIIKMGEELLDKQFGSGLLVSLADHINFVREHDIVNENPIKWEVPHLYFQEYTIGKKALDIIETDLGKKMKPEEASFIALHFVNAQIDQPNMTETIQITQLTKEIVKIIQTITNITLDKNSINYSRFITHLRYFIIRQKNNQNSPTMDAELRSMIQERYMKSYACGLIIKDMVERDFKWTISEDELVYLVIHIERIANNN